MNRNYNGLLVLFFVALLTSALFGGGPEPRIPVGSADIADDSVTNAKLAEPVSVANGGTGKTTAAEALTALGGASLNGSSTVNFSGGSFTATARYLAATGTAAAPAYSFSSDPDTGIYSPGANTLGFGVGGVARMRIDGSGNVGIAVTPTAWASSFRALQISETTAIAQNGFGDSYFANNWYYDGTNTRYISDEPINIYSQINGDHIWESAPLGTGGDIAVISEHMRLTGGGNLLIGTTSDDGANKLQVNGSMRLIGGAAPTATEGAIYFNSTDKHFYGYNGTAWVQLDN